MKYCFMPEKFLYTCMFISQLMSCSTGMVVMMVVMKLMSVVAVSFSSGYTISVTERCWWWLTTSIEVPASGEYALLWESVGKSRTNKASGRFFLLGAAFSALTLLAWQQKGIWPVKICAIYSRAVRDNQVGAAENCPIKLVHACVLMCVYTAAIDQVVDCLDEIDCLTQPVPVDNSLVHRLLNDNRLLSVLEVCLFLFCPFLTVSVIGWHHICTYELITCLWSCVKVWIGGTDGR